MRMPFEQDQSSDSSADQPHDKMRQAKKDLDAGMVDTDLRNSPGQDAERRRELLEREQARSTNGSQTDFRAPPGTEAEKLKRGDAR